MTEQITKLPKELNPRVAELETEFYEEFMVTLPHLSSDQAAAAGLLQLAHRHAEREARLEKEKAEAEYAAVRDPLIPRFYRHRYFLKILDEEAETAKRMSDPHSAVITLDYDDLGIFNKKYGQGAGDTLLIEGANAMLASMRGSDIPGRTGGDEFSVLIYRTGTAGAVAAARRMQKAIIEASQKKFGEQGWTQTISAGICSIGHTPEGLSCKDIADQALIAAKNAGKNAGKNRISIGIFNPDSGSIETKLVSSSEKPSISKHT